MTPRIRLAAIADLDAINAIYNHYTPISSCTFQYEPETPAARRAWFDHHGHEHPVTVAELDDRIVGWASLSAFAPRYGYRHTVEDSVYIHPDLHARGIGRALLADLITRAAQLGHHSIIAKIATDQTASLALHTKLGFVEVGRLREVGRKFDRWIDVFWMQRLL